MDPNSDNDTGRGNTKSRLSSSEVIIRNRIIRSKYLELVSHSNWTRAEIKQHLAQQWGIAIGTLGAIIYEKPTFPSGTRGRKNYGTNYNNNKLGIHFRNKHLVGSCPICGYHSSMVDETREKGE
jgi:hypothetical protein